METTNPVKAIRAFCLACCGDSPSDVRLCNSKDCALHPFRMGSNPFRKKREMTEEQREEAAERFRKYREEQT